MRLVRRSFRGGLRGGLEMIRKEMRSDALLRFGRVASFHLRRLEWRTVRSEEGAGTLLRRRLSGRQCGGSGEEDRFAPSRVALLSFRTCDRSNRVRLRKRSWTPPSSSHHRISLLLRRNDVLLLNFLQLHFRLEITDRSRFDESTNRCAG